MRRGLEKTLRAACGVALALALVHPATAQESESRQERGRVPMAITVAGGGGGYLGVRIADVTAEVVDEMGLSGEYGVHVTSVVEEGPAA
ncbi:MAG: hypothetical protein OEU54_17480, partial [Gemmatimonadota bacterium]|nr:hypothetical protein [Gemmatimonadota bacterium]